jgi:DNA-binding XRE family transcriptional regulator
MRFRNRLREIRLARGLSAAELARRSGISRQTIFTIEANPDYAPRGLVQLALCQALNEERLFWVEREAGDEAPNLT